jgi:hypothetical protein
MPEQRHNSDSQGTAGKYAGPGGGGGANATGLPNLARQMKNNFTKLNAQIVTGLQYNQFRLIRTCHFYSNSQFEYGMVDENGNDKFFHNIVNPRCDHATKNIQLDTKDVTVTTDLENSYWRSWVMRMELREWMREAKFGQLLNRMAANLPKFGTEIWKRVYDIDDDGEKVMRIVAVDLRSVILDQTADTLLDSQIFAERMVMRADKIRDMVDAGGWDKTAVESLLKGTPVKKDKFVNEQDMQSSSAYSLTDVLPSYDIYELWGHVPENWLPSTMFKDGQQPDPAKTRYVMAVLGGVESGGSEEVLFCEDAEETDFPYKANHIRKVPGRFLGIGNIELLIPLQIRINELTNRFYQAIRMGSMHLFQSRGVGLQRNLMQDSQDGDIIESRSPIEPIATEIRAFMQYQNEVDHILKSADELCSTPEIVTGSNMPAGTPFRLGAALGVNAAKIFDLIRQDSGLFIAEVIEDWVMPELANELSEEHVLELMGSSDEMGAFLEAYRKSVLANQVKDYVMKNFYLPSDQEYKAAEQALSDQMSKGHNKLKVEKDFFGAEDMDKYRLLCDPTGESHDKEAEQTTLGTVLQMIGQNPAIMQDQMTRTIIGRILEMSSISPLKLGAFVAQPPAPPQPGEGAPGQVSPSGAQNFQNNPGSAVPGNTPTLVPKKKAPQPGLV